MKYLLSVLFLAGALAVTQPALAQQKIGHVKVSEVLVVMPEYKAAEKKLQDFAVQLEKTYLSMEDEYQKKLKDYYKLMEDENTPPSVLEVKGKEIADLESRMIEFQGNSEQELMDKQVELLKPIESRLKKAIDDVAAESGYGYVLDSSPGGNLLVYPDGDNLTPKVKAKLGI